MRLLSNLCRLFAALFLFAFVTAFAPPASADSTYDAMANFSLSLVDVTDVAGMRVTTGWDVTASGSGDVFLTEVLAANATGSISIVDPAVSLSILDSITQSSTSSGTASNGLAATDALTDLDISVGNSSGMALIFSFDFEVMVDAITWGEANAAANVDMLDDFGFVDIRANADAINGNPAIGTANLIGSIEFMLQDGEFNLISGFVDSFGSATAVPVPATIWLFGSGLISLVGVARRKKA